MPEWSSSAWHLKVILNNESPTKAQKYKKPCLYVWVSGYMSTYVHTYKPIHIHGCVGTHVPLYTHINLYTYIWVQKKPPPRRQNPWWGWPAGAGLGPSQEQRQMRQPRQGWRGILPAARASPELRQLRAACRLTVNIEGYLKTYGNCFRYPHAHWTPKHLRGFTHIDLLPGIGHYWGGQPHPYHVPCENHVGRIQTWHANWAL